MEISAALAAELAALTRSLDADIDLETELRRLGDQIRIAIPSYLGLTLTVPTEDVGLTVCVDPTRAVLTSLRIPLDGRRDPPSGSWLVIYAATSGALVDLAADLGYALALDPGVLAIDEHSTAPPAGQGMTGLAAHSVINQALGILVDRGHTPESAHAELRRIADNDGGNLATVARSLVDAVPPRRSPGQDDP